MSSTHPCWCSVEQWLRVTWGISFLSWPPATPLAQLCLSVAVIWLSGSQRRLLFKDKTSKKFLFSLPSGLIAAQSPEEAVSVWKNYQRSVLHKIRLHVTSIHTRKAEYWARDRHSCHKCQHPGHRQLSWGSAHERLKQEFAFQIILRRIPERFVVWEDPLHHLNTIDQLANNWMPLFPLWSAAALRSTAFYQTNAKVESWFA